MKIKLTKNSEKEIRDWHTGNGRYYISAGDGKTFVSADIGLLKNEKGCYLYLGNSKSVKLTDEQVKILGCYFIEEEEG